VSSTYGWIITRDFLAEGDADTLNINGDVGITGPRDISPSMTLRLHHGHGRKFRMYDEDGELYYEGRILGDLRESEGDPLTDFGAPNAGCTRYAEWQDGEWVGVIS
jgi:hypothetical protein